MTGAIPATRDILARLIAEPSVSRQPNLALLDYVSALFQGSAARIERFASADGTRANLWLSIGPDVPGGVILSGHTDVVPVEGQAWSHDPFTLTEAGGRLYGRGTADMKGFVASALRAALIAAQSPLQRPLYLALSYDEEIGCIGVRSLIEALAARPLPGPALCIVGEPTGMGIATGHKGKRALRACCHGQAGHSALAPKALNALHLGAEFLIALQARQDWLRAHGAQDPAYDIPYSTLHAGVMQGGTALNIVPELCSIDFEIRNVAADDPAEILSGLREDAEKIAARHRNGFPQARIALEEVSGYPGLDTPAGSAAVRFLSELLGGDPKLLKVAFGTEGGLFSEELGLPVLICGPGSMDQGHKADEYVSLDQLARCDAMLEALIRHLCQPAG